jgi:glycosyltransferase involved in cell wall biosynthesis/O-antigen/teichoic acid export membrane protein
MAPADPLHILVLTDRDWTHPQGGGTGTNLYGQISRWIAWGHRVTVVAGSYEGAARTERLSDRLTIHRMGSRLTVFPRAAWATWRGVGRDADVVLEVVNGIAFFTPFWRWLRAPRVLLVHHVHQDHYVYELGLQGRIAAFLLERLPLALLYRGTPVLTISQAARDDLVALGVPPDVLHVAYLGVEPEQFAPLADRAERPTLLYLGRLKAYKRVEVVLDVLEAVPGAVLEIAGDGTHREALEQDIEARGLADRVVMHGFVAEEDKAALYGRAWISLTASSAEGWCLTVMEAAACATPSAALSVGGLNESIVDGETGILADDPAELAARVGELMSDRARVDELGAAARARARGFTWEHAAQANLAVLRRAAEGSRVRLRDALSGSETAKATGLAAASLGNNVIQLLFTVVFTRLLGPTGYGGLAALVSAFLILLVAGSAVQVAAAREAALGRLGEGEQLAATLSGWNRRMLISLVALTAASILLRKPLADLIGVPEHAWAAAAIVPTGVLWLGISLQRGVLQGLHAYAAVGKSIIAEGFGRLIFGLALVGAGAGVTGAYLGTPLALAAVGGWLWVVLRRRTGTAHGAHTGYRLSSLVRGNWGPLLGLTLLAVLQNVDVIVVRHQLGHRAAGSYAAAAVAAKAVVWVAIGIGLHLLPEATRRAAAGLDPRPVLLRALGIAAIVAAPALVIFAVFPHLLLKIAFGERLTQASSALVVLGAAMTLLAVAYLSVQYMIALGQRSFLWVLGLVAIVEPLLLAAGGASILSFAAVVFGLQCVAASGVLALGLRARPRHAAITS